MARKSVLDHNKPKHERNTILRSITQFLFQIPWVFRTFGSENHFTADGTAKRISNTEQKLDYLKMFGKMNEFKCDIARIVKNIIAIKKYLMQGIFSTS
jgi:hypothetical protein